MFNKKLQLNNFTLAIIYKLLHDSLFMFIVFFILALIAEAVLPGIIISHIGFSKMIFVILINILLLKTLAKKIASDQIIENIKTKNKSAKKFIVPLLILGALLIFNSQLEMNIFFNLFFILISGAIGYLSYKVLFE